jgi:molybdopterin-binding protein
MTVEKINWPQGEADVQNLAYAAIQEVTIKNMFTILIFAILTGDTTLNLTIDSQVRKGALLLVRVPATNAADDLALGSGIDAPAIVGVAGKTKTQLFVYDGTAFVAAGAIVQID